MSRAALAALLLAAPAAAAPASPKKQRYPVVVAVDPGHGGKDRGGVVKGRVEAVIALEFSRRLEKRLKALGLAPFLTRERDEFVALSDRVVKAQEAGARALVSIHVDRVYGRNGKGMILYVYGSNPRIPEGPPREPGEILLPRPSKAQVAASRRLAERLRRSLEEADVKVAPYVDLGAFAVLKGANIPSVLVELGNLRDGKEAALLDKAAFQEKAARALAEALRDFLLAEGALSSK